MKAKTCPICQHAKKEVIHAAILSGRLPSVVSHQFRLEPRSLDAHIAHEPALSQVPNEVVSDLTCQAQVSRSLPGLDALETLPFLPSDALGEADVQAMAERQFRTAWKLMNERKRQSNLVWLQDQLQAAEYEVS